MEACGWKSAPKVRIPLRSEVRVAQGVLLMGNEISSEVLESTLARKVAKYGLRCPYRKPTQVDAKKIHRRTGELLLRNSAK